MRQQQNLLLLELLLLLPPRWCGLTSPASAANIVGPKACRFSVVEGQAPVNAAIGGPSLYSCIGDSSLREEPGDIWLLQPPPGVPDRLDGKQVWNLLKVGLNGSIQVAQRIDREDPSLRCYKQEICSKEFSVLLRKQQRSNPYIQLATLDIKDYNDNSPVFGRENRELQAMEGLSNLLLYLPSVTDLDAGKNGQTMTRIVGHDAPVTRSDTVENPDSEKPKLRVNPALDYEQVQGFNITLEACDLGPVARSCSRIQVRIVVIDANDNEPRFSQPEFRLPDLPEDAFEKSGQARLAVGQLEASDRDSGDNGRIEFSLLSGQGSDWFAVDPNNGTVYQTAPINAALNPEISLRVRARDFGSPLRMEDTARVRIRLVDVNDHSPLISVISSGQARLIEGQDNSNFASISAIDSDLGEFGRVACAVDSESANRFQLQPISKDARFQQLSVSTKPGLVYDREVQASDTVGIICWDHGEPARTSSLTLTVSIVDVNEFPPVFNDTVVYNFRVAENRSAGERVGKMTATDRDATAEIEYSISDEGTALGCFSINSSTGLIVTKRRLDREDPVLALSGRPIYVITIQAFDGKYSATARVNIRVIDVNDNPPLLEEASASMSVNESFGGDRVNDKFIGQLTYSDADESDSVNSRASFSLVHTLRSAQELRFSVSPDGHVTASGILDREASQRHLLVVRLTDHGTPALSSTATAVVRLQDLNDNPPRIWSPRPHQQLNLTEDSPPGVSFAEVNVTDADAECERRSSLDCLRSGGLQLRLERQAAALFSVNSSTGQLMVANPLTQGLHRLNLSVTDRGYPKPLTSWVEFSIRVSQRTDRGNHLLGGLFGSANNWTVLLVIVVASSFITVILVVAIVLLNRRQPCCLASGGSSSSSDDPDGGAGGDIVGGLGDKDPPDYQMEFMMEGTLRSQQQQQHRYPPPPPPPPLSPMNPMYGQHGMRRDQNGSGYHPLPYGAALLPWQLGAGGDYDVASADSGHGASEEEIHGEQRGEPHGSRYMSLPVGASELDPRRMQLLQLMEEDPLLSQQQQQQQHENIPLTLSGAGCSTFSRHQHHQQPVLNLLEDPQFNQVKLVGRSPIACRQSPAAARQRPSNRC
ncbi:hypothetical protein BOX15_Mlig027089g1 [Macrostomum lignano]|uniref:Cadherin domain-containing protein n=1 Tax=Macrostomum lignano TaxID=282301 RepID=A0A267EPY7_9PLAT|nr:hypothetical protein BOX15_Mlig027089g1 [Macrostomum lignano]